MADNKVNEAYGTNVESTDRGLFDFMKKKEGSEECQTPEANITSGVEKVHISESVYKEEEEKKHGGLLEKLHRSDSSSSSSSDEEGDDEEKKKKKKEKKEKKGGLKEKLEEKLGHKEHNHDDTNVPIEKVHVQENVYTEPSYPTPHQESEEKKGGFLDKIKDKLPGKAKADDHEVVAPATAPATTPVAASDVPCVEGDKEKKGFLDKIKEKIPGFHAKSEAHEEKKDHD